MTSFEGGGTPAAAGVGFAPPLPMAPPPPMMCGSAAASSSTVLSASATDASASSACGAALQSIRRVWAATGPRSGDVSEGPSESSANIEDTDEECKDDFQSTIPNLERFYEQMAAKARLPTHPPGNGANSNWVLSLARSYRRLSKDKRSRGRLRALLRPGPQGGAQFDASGCVRAGGGVCRRPAKIPKKLPIDVWRETLPKFLGCVVALGSWVVDDPEGTCAIAQPVVARAVVVVRQLCGEGLCCGPTWLGRGVSPRHP